MTRQEIETRIAELQELGRQVTAPRGSQERQDAMAPLAEELGELYEALAKAE